MDRLIPRGFLHFNRADVQIPKYILESEVEERQERREKMLSIEGCRREEKRILVTDVRRRMFPVIMTRYKSPVCVGLEDVY